MQAELQAMLQEAASPEDIACIHAELEQVLSHHMQCHLLGYHHTLMVHARAWGQMYFKTMKKKKTHDMMAHAL